MPIGTFPSRCRSTWPAIRRNRPSTSWRAYWPTRWSTEGIEFTRGLSEPEWPAILVRDLTGALQSWIEIGTPDAARLHKAGKASPRVAVYAHQEPTQWLRTLAGERIHRRAALEIYAIDPGLIDALVERLGRRMSLAVSVTDRELTVSIGR